MFEDSLFSPSLVFMTEDVVKSFFCNYSSKISLCILNQLRIPF